MTTLFLLRHAKAAPASEGSGDFERVLEASGRNDATAIGRYFAQQDFPKPDIILCSPAARTRETLACFLDGAKLSSLPIYDGQELYNSDSNRYIEAISTEAENAETVLVVGHNPMIEDLAHRLFANADKNALAELNQGYVTSGLARLNFDNGFKTLSDKSGTLALFENPSSIDS